MKFQAAVLALALATSASAADDNDNANNNNDQACRLWLAPSNLASPQLAKFGLYAGIDYDADQMLPFPELALPFVDFFIDANKQTPPMISG